MKPQNTSESSTVAIGTAGDRALNAMHLGAEASAAGLKVHKDKALNRVIDQGLIYFGRWTLASHAALVCAALLYGSFASIGALPTTALVAGLVLLSGVQAYQILAFRSLYEAGPRRWRKAYLAISVIQSAWLGLVAGALTFSHGPSYEMLAGAIALLCFINAATDSYAPFPRTYTILVLLSLAPFILACLWLGSSIGVLSATGLVLIGGLAQQHGRKVGTNFWQRQTANFLLRQKLNTLQAEKRVDESNLQLNNEFLNNLGLELRTSLSDIIGSLAVLKESKASDTQRELIRLADKASEKQLELVNNVVDFTRIAHKRLLLTPAVFYPRRDFEELFTELAGEAEDHHIELAYVIAHEMPEKLMGDVARIKQIVRALATNVIRFSERGEIFVDVQFDVRSAAEGELKVLITDDGHGKPDADQRSLFNAFARIKHTKAGTGLGLAICKGIAECMGGEVGFTGSEESGREFKFRVPLEIRDNNRLSFAPNLKLHGKEILLVNAPSKIREHLAEELENWGMRVSYAEGNRKVIEGLAQDPGRFCAALLFTHRQNSHVWDIAKEICLQQNLAQFPVFLAATNREIKTFVTRDFIIQFPHICVVQKPLHYKQFHDLLVQELFNIDLEHRPYLLKMMSAEESNQGSRILLVEDHRVNQMVAEGMLKKLGYRPQIANNGREALDMLSQEHFDLILMDCQMAEMDGYTATEHIRRREIEAEAETRIPIIALTAHTADEDRSRCLAVGMDDYLPKPVRIADLESRLQHWLREQRPTRHH